jgi:hypothetical protein
VAAAIPVSIAGTEQSFRLRTTPMRDDEGRLLGAVISKRVSTAPTLTLKQIGLAII